MWEAGVVLVRKRSEETQSPLRNHWWVRVNGRAKTGGENWAVFKLS